MPAAPPPPAATCRPSDVASVIAEERTYVRNVHAPHAVRLFVDAQLGVWGLGHLAATVQVVANELVTNAVQNARGDDIAVRLEPCGDAVRVKVWDDNPDMPSMRTPDVLSEGGRGLAITGELSEHWECYPAERGGKVVSALITKGEL